MELCLRSNMRRTFPAYDFPPLGFEGTDTESRHRTQHTVLGVQCESICGVIQIGVGTL